GAPLRQRLQTSRWTSVGICAFVLLGHARRWATEDAAEDEHQASSAPEAPLRRLREAAGGSSVGDKYPPDLVLTKPYRDDPNRWLVILHVIGIGYMLLGLNTVCDVYFTGALEEMVENWDVQDDVAGATFMAAGGSAPEFFTALIGTTIVENDVGFGTIVGSAVFNVLFVIGLCGWVAPTAMELTWWPLFRDCSYYPGCLQHVPAACQQRSILYGDPSWSATKAVCSMGPMPILSMQHMLNMFSPLLSPPFARPASRSWRHVRTPEGLCGPARGHGAAALRAGLLHVRAPRCQTSRVVRLLTAWPPTSRPTLEVVLVSQVVGGWSARGRPRRMARPRAKV
ncbi:unnamed protein product, partial [Prorocentrum cordatum]